MDNVDLESRQMNFASCLSWGHREVGSGMGFVVLFKCFVLDGEMKYIVPLLAFL